MRHTGDSIKYEIHKEIKEEKRRTGVLLNYIDIAKQRDLAKSHKNLNTFL